MLRIDGRATRRSATKVVLDGVEPQPEPRRPHRGHRAERHRQVDAAQAHGRRVQGPRRRDASRTRSTPDAGEVRWGHDTSVGYFAQDHHEALGATAKGTTPYEWLYRFDTRGTQEEIRAILGRLLFSGDAALKPTEALSGGEAARLLLGKMVLGTPQRAGPRRADEPPRHRVDRGPPRGLLKFEGTVVFVSHDHHFVARLATRIIELRDRPEPTSGRAARSSTSAARTRSTSTTPSANRDATRRDRPAPPSEGARGRVRASPPPRAPAS